MLYQIYDMNQAALAPMRFAAELTQAAFQNPLFPLSYTRFGRTVAAGAEMFERTTRRFAKPEFGLHRTEIDGREVTVEEETIVEKPFCRLLRFKRDTKRNDPKLLVVAPMSGHHATLLRGTVEALLPHHDVYITDWKNARDVPLSAGRFGFDDYVDYVIRFLQELGEGAHLVSVCQPCVPAMAAVALMSEDQDKATPRSMTLMGGPIDPNAAPTAVNDLANEKPIKWFEENLISVVPFRYAGRGREVYPGFLQLSAFVSMNMARHGAQHRELYQLLADGKTEQADKIKTFYEEYFAVHDMTKEFYLETVDMVFQRTLLAKGELTVRGRKIDLGAIRKTALLTVEGERDDVCAVGQTSAAHALCTGLRPHLKRHHLQPGVGHYGVFSGSKWEKQVYPQVRNMILAMN